MKKGAMQRLLLWVLGFLATSVSAAAQSDQAQVARLTVHVDREGPRISRLLYGIFFEEINRAGEAASGPR